MICWALVPLKNPAIGKQRLRDVLSPVEREQLILDMQARVVTALREAEGVTGIAMVTEDKALVPDGVTWIADPGGGLNAAITASARHLEALGASHMLVVAADLPLLTAGEIEAMLGEGGGARVVIATDRAERGTNALLLSPPTCLQPAFGEDSLARHEAAAAALNIATRTLKRPRLQLDVDTQDDLALWRDLL